VRVLVVKAAGRLTTLSHVARTWFRTAIRAVLRMPPRLLKRLSDVASLSSFEVSRRCCSRRNFQAATHGFARVAPAEVYNPHAATAV